MIRLSPAPRGNHPERTIAESTTATVDSQRPVERIGPVLFWRGHHVDGVDLVALIAQPASETEAVVATDAGAIEPEFLHAVDGIALRRYAFTLPERAPARYAVDGTWYPVDTAVSGDLRIAFVACNGQEAGDRQRDPDERNALWQRLAQDHAEKPFQLLLHGGDQLYADEMLDAHPAARAWAEDHTAEIVRDADPQTVLDAMRRFLLERYLELYSQSASGWLMAHVPSLAMWDDHDICDGWGSLLPQQLDHPIGRAVFTAAHEFFLLFQFGCRVDEVPSICPDRSGATLSWVTRLPGLAVIAPDLRSERRPDRVLGPAGEAFLHQVLPETTEARVLLISSVPALGPRLSWFEMLMQVLPGMQEYEDDLRDQWQSRAHREEWRAFLQGLLAVHERDGTAVTALSGEIHLATRGTMAARGGDLHQLVASGITHPPPNESYARALGLLARLGESPVPGHPIRLHPLPGQRRVYTPQRNYLILERTGDAWRTWWQLEQDGATPALTLDTP